MQQYLELLKKVRYDGQWQENRTGIPTLRLDGAMLQFDLRDGFPAMTTKKLAFGAVKGELLGFIQGCTNAKRFRELGCKVWDQNANENEAWLANPNRKGEDDLGRIYGAQWRGWNTGWDTDWTSHIDQLANAMLAIERDPTNRRIIVSAWNPAEMDQMALPPCHLLYQFLVDVATNTVSLCMYQRSCDMFLGIPFNIASYALLLELVAAATGRIAGNLTMFLADVHIYKNHLEQVDAQLTRTPLHLCRLKVKTEENVALQFARSIDFLELIEPKDIELVGYESWGAIKADMAV